MSIQAAEPEKQEVVELRDDGPARRAQEAFEMLHDTGQAEVAVAMLRSSPGQKWVYNRLPQPYEKFFDGIPYKWEANDQLQLPEEVAHFMERTSIVKYDAETGEAVRALVTTENPKFGVPYLVDLGPELLSRETNDNYIQRGSGGLPTHAKVIAVRGGGFDQGRPIAPKSRI